MALLWKHTHTHTPLLHPAVLSSEAGTDGRTDEALHRYQSDSALCLFLTQQNSIAKCDAAAALSSVWFLFLRQELVQSVFKPPVRRCVELR